jgi:hypothetical protein
MKEFDIALYKCLGTSLFCKRISNHFMLCYHDQKLTLFGPQPSIVEISSGYWELDMNADILEAMFSDIGVILTTKDITNSYASFFGNALKNEASACSLDRDHMDTVILELHFLMGGVSLIGSLRIPQIQSNLDIRLLAMMFNLSDYSAKPPIVESMTGITNNTL